MNFAAVDQCKGQMDGQYARKTQVFATFTEVGGQALTSNQKPTVKVKLTDDQGASHTVHLYGNTLPNANMLNQRSCFDLSAFDGQGQGGPYVGYQGFWNSSVQTNQQPAQNQPQQPAPQNRQPANAPAGQHPEDANKPVDWDGKQQREFRSHAIHSATLLVVALAEVNKESRGMSPELVVQMAETYVKYVYNGREAVPNNQGGGQNPSWVGDDPPPPGDSDIPFKQA